MIGGLDERSFGIGAIFGVLALWISLSLNGTYYPKGQDPKIIYMKRLVNFWEVEPDIKQS